MHLVRGLIAATSSIALVLGVGVVGAAADPEPAPQPLTLLGPETGATPESPRITFTWQPPADQEQATIAVSTKSTTKNGALPSSGRNAFSWDVDGAAGTFTDKRYVYPPDTYYWQVTATDAAGATYRSEVRKLVVPVFFELSKVKAKTVASGGRYIHVTAVMRCNYFEDQYYTQFTTEAFVGKRSVGSSVTAYGDCVGMYPTKVRGDFAPQGVKPGTKLTLKVRGRSTMDSTVRWGGSDIEKANGPITTIHVTW